jgi:aryl-alcohol dehydrogenase-like predicted oxidoreductase
MEPGAHLENLSLPIVGPILVAIVLLFIGSPVGSVLPLPLSIPILVATVGGEILSILWDVRHQRISIGNVSPAAMPVGQARVQGECRGLTPLGFESVPAHAENRSFYWQFLPKTPGTGVAFACGYSSPTRLARTRMKTRTLGRTGEQVSIIGLGGAHIGRQDDPQDSVRIIRSAIDRGITFLDNSWSYHEGQSEIRMGAALRDGYRQKVFLMSKIDGRTVKAAADQIDESLARLQTDCVDLMQFHEVIRIEDPDRIFGRHGALEAMLAAREAGKIRYIGFSGHKDPMIHGRMLDVARDHGFRFDAVQMPLNPMDVHFRSFQHHILTRIVGDEIGALGMKAMGGGHLLKSGTVGAEECLRYALSLPVSAVITGIDSLAILDQAVTAAETFVPMSDQELIRLLGRTREAARGGRFERFKTDVEFDSTAKNPEWLGRAPAIEGF